MNSCDLFLFSRMVFFFGGFVHCNKTTQSSILIMSDHRYINNCDHRHIRIIDMSMIVTLLIKLKFCLMFSNQNLPCPCPCCYNGRYDLVISNQFSWKTFNIEVYRISRQHPVSEMIEVRRWRYLGHTLRRQGSIPHTSLGWAPEGKRRRGRPKKTWRMTALDQLRSFGIQSWEEAAERAKDRKRWREQEMDILAQYSTRNPAT